MYYKIINDRMVLSRCLTIITADGHPVSNPTEEQIFAAGWQVYVPPVVPPTPQSEPYTNDILDAVKRMLSTETEELTDEEALDVAALFPTWSSKLPKDGELQGEPVVAGDRLWDDGKLWKVVQPHNVMSNWRPADSPSLFVEVSIEEIPDWRQPTGAQDIYMAGDKVKHNGHTWESEVDNNSWEPGVYGWQQLD